MSQDKVEIVRGLYPPEGIEMVALVEDVQALKRNYGPILHPDFEVSADPEALTMVGVEGATASGMDGFIAVWRDWCNAFETYRVIPREFVGLPDGRVLVLVENRAQTKTEGVEMAFEGAAIWTLEGGLVRKVEQFVDRERALEAAGLKE
jgi:hypothetical protein